MAHPNGPQEMINEGTIDRVLRVIVGLVLVSLVFVGPQTPWGWIGVPLLTGSSASARPTG